MRTRALTLTILLSLAALLSACVGMPSILAPTAEPPTALPVATSAGGAATEVVITPAATEPASTSPLPTPAVEPRAAITPTVSAAITPTLAVETNQGATSTAATAAATAIPGAQGQEKVEVPMVASGAAGNPTEAQGAASTAYSVHQGDTLAKIAARFGVTLAAILKANPQIKNPDHIYIGQRIMIPGSGSTPPPAGNTRVNIFMIGMGGGSVGCGDQVVAIPRDVPATGAPLTAALNLLLSQKSQYYGESGLYNPLYQSNLSVSNITSVGTSWTVRLTGTLRLGGVCDNPRVKAQLEQTALQFSTVKSVRYFVNGKTLDTVLSGK